MSRPTAAACAFVALIAAFGCGDDDSGADAGPDAGPPSDGEVDAGPDVPASSCATACEGDRPICDEEGTEECVQCLTPTDCEGMGVNTMCNDAGTCVQCVDSTQCTEPGASECATEGIMAGSCVGCTVGVEGACAGVEVDGTALNVCDDSAGSGVCVECNADDETACGDTVCNVPEQTCTDDTPVGMAATCAPCVSDRQCSPGQTCAPTVLGEMDAGHFCLWDLNAPELPPTACPLPFGTLRDVMTIGDESARSCQLRFSTCAAHADHSSSGRAAMNCEGAMTSEADADCGSAELNDGFCITNAAIARDRCTVQCGAPDDCVIDGSCYGCPAVAPGETRVCDFTPIACP